MKDTMQNYDELKTIPCSSMEGNIKTLNNNLVCSQCKEAKPGVKLTEFGFGLKLFCCEGCKC
jgi:hypothetical protein